jgi:hypothetical protein
MAKWSDVQWGTVITGAVALYGAALSTFNYLAQRRRDRRLLKVEIDDPGDEGLFPPILHVNAVNIGYRSIHLADVGIVLKDGTEIVWTGRFTTHDNLPCELREGKKFTANIMVNDLSDLLVENGRTRFARIRGQLIDEAGKVYRGRWYRFRMRKWVLGKGATSI